MTYQDRFGGIGRLYGVDQLSIYQTAHACVVGIGGVGSWAAEGLARSGVGKITLIDLDDICVTNVNRQVHALTETVGQLKIDVMADRIRSINPDCEVVTVMDFVDAKNVADLIHKDFDCVVDCIDSLKPKAALLNHCKRSKIPMISTGAAGGQTDPTKIEIADLNKTFNDPLIRRVRSWLRRNYGYSRNPKRTYSIPVVYSTEQLVYPQPDGSVCQQKALDDGSTKLDCNTGFGAVTMVTASFGFMAANKALELMTKHILKKRHKAEA
ncbi:tRNA cyclic N6-threonylcarbamoyladenosine(37) synthase TcdA [Litoribacillus peritrichatus]|uniref:tRNA cyclic N6-threonylcarbamoyladenosine(37) synthase TcdA n=1 Tax=Litoribacillus peritrichatus TaxID=718191 RepID=A0ABP7M4D9_9GAMM